MNELFRDMNVSKPMGYTLLGIFFVCLLIGLLLLAVVVLGLLKALFWLV